MKPNVLVIFADQMRADFMGCAGHPVVRTPNLDRLARDGVRFTNAYTPDPICVPARATFTTGSYPHKCTGTKNNAGRIRDDQVKIAELFAANGYETYASGKLHYVPYAGPGEPRLLHGFRHAALHESGRIVKRDDPTGTATGLEDYHDFLRAVGWDGYDRAHGVGNNDIHPAPSPLPAEYCPDAWVSTRAMQYLDEHRTETPDKPFFMFMSTPKPHAPYDPPRPYDSLYDPRDLPAPFTALETGGVRTPTKAVEGITHGWDKISPAAHRVARAFYGGLVTFQDHQIGRMLAYLEEHKLLDSTIVVYTADHGDLMGDFGFFAKSAFYRGSVNIPLIVHWPAALQKNKRSDELVGLQDVLPTLASLCGITLPAPVDGIDLAPGLRGQAQPEREFYVAYCMDEPQQLYMVADKRLKYMYSQVGAVEELYDLEADPGEQTNLARRDDMDGTLRTMRDRLRTWVCENGDNTILDGETFRTAPPPDLDALGFEAHTLGWRWF